MATESITVGYYVTSRNDKTIGMAVKQELQDTADITACAVSFAAAAVMSTVLVHMAQSAVIQWQVNELVSQGTYSDYVMEIRERLMDFVDENILIEGEQVNDSAILKALTRALRDYNDCPPIKTKFTMETHPYIDTIILKTLSLIFDTLAIAEFRNQLNYAASGVQLGIRDKGNIYKTLADSYNQEYRIRRDQEKGKINMEACYGNAAF